MKAFANRGKWYTNSYFQICNFGGYRYWDGAQKFPYRSNGNQWVSYEDMQSLKHKV